MSDTDTALLASTMQKRPERSSLGKDNLLSVFDALVGPAALVLSLWALAQYYEGEILPPYLILSIIVFALSFPGQARLQSTPLSMVFDITLHCA